MPKGYYTGYGYMGRMPDGTWLLFATDTEYHAAYYSESE